MEAGPGGTALAALDVCWELSSSSAKSLCQMFGRGTELSWAVSKLMLNPQPGWAVSASGLRRYVLYLLLGFTKITKYC